MPLASSFVGARSAAMEHVADARWTMAYAAALGDTDAVYFDTTGAAPRAAGLPGVIAHPCFPVCLEWPVIVESRGEFRRHGLLEAESRRGVHATHDLHLLRPIHAGETLRTHAEVVAVQARKPGAYQVTRLDTLDAAGELVARTWQGSLFRGVAVDGPDTAIAEVPEVPVNSAAPATAVAETELSVAAGAAHVYTECARIWNPIHTDLAVAQGAGLPELILHGTATLALAVSALVRQLCPGQPQRVRRLGCRFAGMVRMPATLRLRPHVLADGQVLFSVLDGAGNLVLAGGHLTLG